MSLSRRQILWAAPAFTGMLLSRKAYALKGVEPAITVRHPAQVFLVAIARAGNRLVAVGELGVVIYSDDSGASWTQAAVPVDVTLTCVAFATPLIGWAAGHAGIILATKDGGKSWAIQLDGNQVNDLITAAANAAQTSNSPSPALPASMRRASLFAASGPSRPFLCMLVFDPQKVMIFGAYRMAVLTTDGGKTWTDNSLNIYDAVSHNINDAEVIDGAIYLAGETGLVFCSTDGGATFPQLTPACEATLFGILGANDGSLITFGVAGNGARSTDKGKTWTPINFETQDNLVAALKLPSGMIAVARQSGGMLTSRDNGVTFTPVANFPPIFASDFVQAPDNSLAFAGGGGAATVPLSLLNS